MGKKRNPNRYIKYQKDTVKRMYDAKIFINHFGEIDYEMYTAITGLSEKKVQRIIDNLWEKDCENYYSEYKKRYKNKTTLLLRLLCSRVSMNFIMKKFKLTAEEIYDIKIHADQEHYDAIWKELKEKKYKTQREYNFCWAYLMALDNHILKLQKQLYSNLLEAGKTEEEALAEVGVDKETMDKYLSMTEEQTEEYLSDIVGKKLHTDYLPGF